MDKLYILTTTTSGHLSQSKYMYYHCFDCSTLRYIYNRLLYQIGTHLIRVWGCLHALYARELPTGPYS